jgi:hypothetical protein
MMNSKLVVAAIAALGLTAGRAYAQEEGEEEGTGEEGMAEGEGEATPPPETPPPAAEEDDGDTGAGMGLTVPKGKIDVSVAIGVNLSKDKVAKPITIAPDIFYGVSDKLDVGVAHSAYGLAGWWAEGGGGGALCVTGKENGCAKAYDGPVGILAHFGLMEGNIDLAADGGVIIRKLSDPMQLGLKLGVKGRKMAGKIAIGYNPNIYIGLNKRTIDAGGVDVDLNKEQLNVPVDAMFMVNDKIAVGLQTGIYGPLSHFGDFFAIPVSLGGLFHVNDNITAGAAFNLLRVTGGSPEGFEAPGAADLRTLTLFVDWHN